jgi:hypothetical protein
VVWFRRIRASAPWPPTYESGLPTDFPLRPRHCCSISRGNCLKLSLSMIRVMFGYATNAAKRGSCCAARQGEARREGTGAPGGMKLCVKMHALPEAADSETHLSRRSCRGGGPQPAVLGRYACFLVSSGKGYASMGLRWAIELGGQWWSVDSTLDGYRSGVPADFRNPFRHRRQYCE